MKKRYLVVFWVSGRCNLNCTYCYAENICKEDMSFETAKSIIDNLKEFPLKIQFAGGEPTVNFPLIEKICHYISDNNIDAVFQMQTNGTLLTGKIASKIKELGINTGVSLDGIPEINELTRGRTADAVKGILNLKSENIMIGLNAVVTRKNIHYLPTLIDFSLWLGNVGGIGLDLLRNAGGAKSCFDNLVVSEDELRKCIISMYNRSNEIYQMSGLRIQLREIEEAKSRLRNPVQENGYCYASCGRSVVVLPNGKTYPCGSLVNDDYYMGTVETLKPEGILKISEISYNKCKYCEFNYCCPKGCPSRVMINEKSDLDCVMKKTAFQIAKDEINKSKGRNYV